MKISNSSSDDTEKLNAILHNIIKPSSRMTHTLDEVIDLTERLTYKVNTKFDGLNAILLRHEEALCTRWRKLTLAKRRTLLLDCWPDIPQFHRAAHFTDDETYIQPRKAEAVPSSRLMWPYINLEDLQDKESLLIFIKSRGRYAPHTFALTEHIFMPTVRMDDTRFLNHRMRLDDRENYGKFYKFKHIFTAQDFEHQEKGRKVGEGLQVLKIQDFILSFLTSCCEKILPQNAAQNAITEYPVPVLLSVPNSKLQDAVITSFEEAMQRLPYQPRGMLPIERMLRLTMGIKKLHEDDIR